jgi:hypothetical protein
VAKAKTEAEYQEWIKEVAAKVPDEQKASFEAIVGSVGMDLFGGHLREKEFHRRLNEVADERRELESQRAAFAQDVNSMDSWFNEEAPKNQRLIAERDRLKTEATLLRERLETLGLEEEPTPRVKSARSDDTSAIEKEIQALKHRITAMDQALPAMLGDYGVALLEAQKEGVNVDPRQMIAISMERSVPLPQAYQMLTYEERSKRQEKAQEEALAKAREDGRREALSQRGSPEFMKPSGPTVTQLLQKPLTSEDRINEAVAMYRETAR